MNSNRIAVIGAGTMGIGVTVDLLLHGFEVVLHDIAVAQLDRAFDDVMQKLRFFPLWNKQVAPVSGEEASGRLTATTQLERACDCHFVIENVPEVWETKRSVYIALDRICPREACFAANTSCIPIARIATATDRPASVIGMHFMNPAFLDRPVEVIPAEQTSEACLRSALALLNRLGKESILVKDFPGFVSNRVSHVFINEAARLLDEQLSTADQVDDIFRRCFQHRMGPLETADLIGLDTVVHSLDILYESYRDSRFLCSRVLRELVEAGRLGRKSGRGFYTYPLE